MRRELIYLSVVGFAILALTALATAHADVNLAGICTSGAASGQQACASPIYDYPSDNRYVKTPGGYYFWGTIASSAQVSVCASDIPRGSATCPTPTTLVKSSVPLSAPPTAPPPITPVDPGTFAVRVTWVPPTLQTDDAGQVTPLPPADILGYKLTWYPEGDFVNVHYVDLPGNALTYVFTAPKARICAHLSVTGRDLSSDRSGIVCVDPTKVLMRPHPVSGFVLTPEP